MCGRAECRIVDGGRCRFLKYDVFFRNFRCAFYGKCLFFDYVQIFVIFQKDYVENLCSEKLYYYIIVIYYLIRNYLFDPFILFHRLI